MKNSRRNRAKLAKATIKKPPPGMSKYQAKRAAERAAMHANAAGYERQGAALAVLAKEREGDG